MKVSNKRSQGGFTLVEMSVVLLVIGRKRSMNPILPGLATL